MIRKRSEILAKFHENFTNALHERPHIVVSVLYTDIIFGVNVSGIRAEYFLSIVLPSVGGELHQ